jgi:hypothetical protein
MWLAVSGSDRGESIDANGAGDVRIADMHDQSGRQAEDGSHAIGDIVRAACLMAGHDEIGAVRVVLHERPTFGDVLRMRQFALARGLDVAIGASDIAFRRAPVDDGGALDANAEAADHGPISPSRRAATIERTRSPLHGWPRQHARMLRDALLAMGAGPR